MKKNNFFWIGYSDLLTSLFFVILVLFVLTYAKLYRDKEATEKELEKIKEIRASVEKLDTALFLNNKVFKRYELKEDIKFRGNQWDLSRNKVTASLVNPADTVEIEKVGNAIKRFVDDLLDMKKKNPIYKNVSYVFIIAGYSSDLRYESCTYDERAYTNYDTWGYVLSYQRAKALYDYWKNHKIIDLDSKKYNSLIEVMIAGNGYGGIGRYNPDKLNVDKQNLEERKNQRFTIQIVPKNW